MLKTFVYTFFRIIWWK